MRLALLVALALGLGLLAPTVALDESSVTLQRRSVSLYVPAVAQLEAGDLVGVLSVLTLTVQEPGQGDVFVRTEPLAEIDMQGAARLAVAAAAEVTGRRVRDVDFFYSMTTGSPVIGGPSAGGAMAMAATAALMGWDLDPNVGMTGMINPDLSIGPVGGILEKAEAMAGVNIRTFLVPAGQTHQTVVVQEPQPDGSVQEREETVDVVEHARSRWNMEVREIEDLYDALPPFTGNRVDPPAAQGDPTQRAEYQDLMADLSGRQLSGAQERFDAARADFDRLQPSMGAADRGTVREALVNAENTLARAQSTSTQDKHYQASSYAFQSLVSSRYAQALLDFYESPGDVAAYTADYLAAVRTELETATANSRRPYPWTASELGSQGALEMRLADAEALLARAATAAEGGAHASSLQDASYARERIGSATWWGLVRDRLETVGPPANVTRETLRALFAEYEASATLMVTYAERIVQEAGAAAPERLTAAATTVAQARASAERESYAGALFGALHAMSQVNAAIAALGGSDLAARVDVVRERAAYEIERARSLGIEPVFAVSLFEFADAQRAQDAEGAHEGFTWARMSARATLVAAGASPGPAPWSPVRLHAERSLGDRVFTGASWTWVALVAVPFTLALGLASVLVPPREPMGKSS